LLTNEVPGHHPVFALLAMRDTAAACLELVGDIWCTMYHGDRQSGRNLLLRSKTHTGVEMTIDEFNKTAWHPNMFAIYHGRKHPISACDFEEALIALDGVVLGSDEPSWVRCENIELVAA